MRLLGLCFVLMFALSSAQAARIPAAVGPYDMATSVNSVAVSADRVKASGLQMVITGSPVGSAKVQASNDDLSPANWTDLSGTTAAINGAGTVLYSMSVVPYNWVRVVYTATSGTGSFELSAVVKE